MGRGDWRPEAPSRETALTSIVDCSSKRSSIAEVTSVVPRFILLRTRPARWASIRTKISTLIMYKDGRFANLQRRREYDLEYRRRRAATETPQEKETKLECWSQRDRESTSHAYSRNFMCTRTQFHVIELFPAVKTCSHLVSYNCSRSQPGFAREQTRRISSTHHQVWGLPRLAPITGLAYVRSTDCANNLQIGFQSEDSQIALRNLQTAQIPRSRNIYLAPLRQRYYSC